MAARSGHCGHSAPRRQSGSPSPPGPPRGPLGGSGLPASSNFQKLHRNNHSCDGGCALVISLILSLIHI
eukprot:1048007-Pyramimonas_sp.AAC.1